MQNSVLEAFNYDLSINQGCVFAHPCPAKQLRFELDLCGHYQ